MPVDVTSIRRQREESMWSGSTTRVSSIHRTAEPTSQNFDISIETSYLLEALIRMRQSTGGIFPLPNGRSCHSRNGNLEPYLTDHRREHTMTCSLI